MSEKISVWLLTIVLLGTVSADAQQQAKIPRLGYLTGGDSSPNEAFVQGLRDLGYFEDKNIVIEIRKALHSPGLRPNEDCWLAARKQRF